jgi:hypothetical protein
MRGFQHEAVKHRVRLEPSRDLTTRADAYGICALGSRVERGEASVGSADEAMRCAARINKVSRNHATRVDAQGKRAFEVQAGVRARSVECGDGSVGSADEAVKREERLGRC